MNSLIYKTLIVATAIVALAISPGRAQTIQRVEDALPEFGRIAVGGDFVLEVRYAKQYSATLQIEELFADYVQVAVEDSTLTVSVDERRVPADVRRLYRGRDALPPVFNLRVTMPETLSYLRLSDRASLGRVDELVIHPDELGIRVTDNAVISGLTTDARRVSLDLDKRANVSMRADSDTLFVRMAGNSTLMLEQHSKRAVVNAVSNASLTLDGETEEMTVSVKGTTKTILNGQAGKVKYEMANSSSVNAYSLQSGEANAVLSGICTLYDATEKDLTVDLSHGATLIFLNSPAIHVENIRNSSLIPYEKK